MDLVLRFIDLCGVLFPAESFVYVMRWRVVGQAKVDQESND